MLLIEADGKALLAASGITVPFGVVMTGSASPLSGAGPWMVKAQVPVGGRGQAGGIIRCVSQASVEAATLGMIGTRLKGHTIEACLVEQFTAGEECYLAIMVDAAGYGLRVMYAALGGVDIERTGSVQTRVCPPHQGAVVEALADLTLGEPDAWRQSEFDRQTNGRDASEVRTRAGRNQSTFHLGHRLRSR